MNDFVLGCLDESGKPLVLAGSALAAFPGNSRKIRRQLTFSLLPSMIHGFKK